jgi:hypothetical protein
LVVASASSPVSSGASVETPPASPNVSKAPSRRDFSGEPSSDDLRAFASETLAAARASKALRPFGPGKVFISRAWEEVEKRGGQFAAMGAEMFKRWLALANNRGLVGLSRADLVEDLDPKDVAESETAFLTSRFHFIRV